MFRKSNLILVVLLLSSCASLPAINYVASPSLEPEQVFTHLLKMTQKCLSRKANLLRDAKIVKYGLQPGGKRQITLHHYASDIGLQEAELTITISPDSSEVIVSSKEITDQTEALVRDRAANINRIKMWVNGDSSCAVIARAE